MVYGGPSFFRLSRTRSATSVIGEAGGTFTTVAADETIDRRSKKSLTGFNVGADATYIVWRTTASALGAGGFVRFTQAATRCRDADAPTQPTDVGGMQFGFGARLRF